MLMHAGQYDTGNFNGGTNGNSNGSDGNGNSNGSRNIGDLNGTDNGNVNDVGGTGMLPSVPRSERLHVRFDHECGCICILILLSSHTLICLW